MVVVGARGIGLEEDEDEPPPLTAPSSAALPSSTTPPTSTASTSSPTSWAFRVAILHTEGVHDLFFEALNLDLSRQ